MQIGSVIAPIRHEKVHGVNLWLSTMHGPCNNSATFEVSQVKSIACLESIKRQLIVCLRTDIRNSNYDMLLSSTANLKWMPWKNECLSASATMPNTIIV